MTTEIIVPLQPELPVQSRRWYEIWWDVWLHPGIAPFQAMLKDTNHSMTRGFIWVGVTSFIITLISYLFSALVMRNFMADAFRGTPLENGGYFALSYICGIILSPIFAIIGIAISSGVYHWVAKLFRGKGVWSDLVYCLSAVSTPGTLIAGVVGVFSLLFFNHPVFIFLPVFIAFVFAIYMIVLNVNAIRAVEDVGPFEALGAIFIPTIVIVVLVTCCSLVALVPIFSTVVKGIN
jgi:hypothetical protein